MSSSSRSVDDFIKSFPHQDLPQIQGEPNYSTLKDLRMHLKTNAASIHSTRGGGNHGHLGLVVSDAIYGNIAPGTPYNLPANPGRLPTIPANATGPQINEVVRQHTADLKEYTEFQNLHTALKKQLTQAVDPIYLRAIRNPHSEFLNVTLREMLAHLFDEYGAITDFDLAGNEEAIRQAWNPAEPFDNLIQQIEDCQEYADDAGQAFTDRQILSISYHLVFNTGLYFDDCKRWMSRPLIERTWENFKTQFRAASKLLRLQQKTSQQAGFHGANAMTQDIQHETAEALAHLATAASADRQALATMTSTIENLSNQIKDKDDLIKTLKQELNRNKPNTRTTPQDNGSYCHTHGYLVAKNHTSETCKNPGPEHKKDATRSNPMNGSTRGKPE